MALASSIAAFFSDLGLTVVGSRTGIMLAMLFVAGAKLRHLAPIVGIAVLMAPLALMATSARPSPSKSPLRTDS